MYLIMHTLKKGIEYFLKVCLLNYISESKLFQTNTIKRRILTTKVIIKQNNKFYLINI